MVLHIETVHHQAEAFSTAVTTNIFNGTSITIWALLLPVPGTFPVLLMQHKGGWFSGLLLRVLQQPSPQLLSHSGIVACSCWASDPAFESPDMDFSGIYCTEMQKILLPLGLAPSFAHTVVHAVWVQFLAHGASLSVTTKRTARRTLTIWIPSISSHCSWTASKCYCNKDHQEFYHSQPNLG